MTTKIKPSTIVSLPQIDIVSHRRAIVSWGDTRRQIDNLTAAGDTNTKLRKSSGFGFLTRGFSMSPSRIGSFLSLPNSCGDESPGCAGGCLGGCGLGAVFPAIQESRLAKKILYFNAREWTIAKLVVEIRKAYEHAKSLGMRLAVRLNVLSDIRWEDTGILELFPDVQFYDYTKHPGRFGLVRPNYWVTFSRSEINESDSMEVLQAGGNVAVVFHQIGRFAGNASGRQRLPKSYRGFQVIDGDKTDLRFDDPRGRSRGKVVGLRLKAPTTRKRQLSIDNGFSVLVR